MDMEHQLFTTLPTEIITNIFTRVPCKTIGICKCVCKPWLGLLNTPEFAKYHLSKSVPQLIVYVYFSPKLLKVFELVDKVDLESHKLHYNPLGHKKFMRIPGIGINLEGSANGLLFLCGRLNRPDSLYVCNPITHEYIQLPYLDPYKHSILVMYGFGVSMMSNQYKVVRILQDCVRDYATSGLKLSIRRSECRVYTLGTTKSWRSVASLAHSNSYYYFRRLTGAFINGNLHWLVADFNHSLFVSCFDLETEQFKFFAAPPPVPGRLTFIGDIAFFENCLCICDNTSQKEIDIWVMKEYGIEKSWTKLMVIRRIPGIHTKYYPPICPLKLFKDGDVLMLFGDYCMFYYSSKTNTTTRFELFERQAQNMFQARLHVWSFLSLKSFATETVSKY